MYWNVGLYSSALIFDETEQVVPEERIAVPAVYRWYADTRLFIQAVDVIDVQLHDRLPTFRVVVGKYRFKS